MHYQTKQAKVGVKNKTSVPRVVLFIVKFYFHNYKLILGPEESRADGYFMEEHD
jgi:hypothetical protein